MTHRRDLPIAQTLQKQLGDLQRSGMTGSEIASATKLGRKTIWRYATGQAEAPRYRNAARVEALHRKKIGEP